MYRLYCKLHLCAYEWLRGELIPVVHIANNQNKLAAHTIRVNVASCIIIIRMNAVDNLKLCLGYK
jgi:hypothetical protein